MKVIMSEDGSHTIQLDDTDECYHSRHGAIQESRHVFIDAGLRAFAANNTSTPIRILEIGFGTGLNALLSAVEASSIGPISYTAIEPFPVSSDLLGMLNYESQIPVVDGLFEKLHACEWDKTNKSSDNFDFFKTKTKIESQQFESPFDVVYFDAFSPEAQPELWSLEMFETLRKCMSKAGLLVTYCVKGIVKKRLRDAEFFVERLPGPPGKRHMIRARV